MSNSKLVFENECLQVKIFQNGKIKQQLPDLSSVPWHVQWRNEVPGELKSSLPNAK
jgi:hypothetical protein